MWLTAESLSINIFTSLTVPGPGFYSVLYGPLQLPVFSRKLSFQLLHLSPFSALKRSPPTPIWLTKAAQSETSSTTACALRHCTSLTFVLMCRYRAGRPSAWTSPSWLLNGATSEQRSVSYFNSVFPPSPGGPDNRLIVRSKMFACCGYYYYLRSSASQANRPRSSSLSREQRNLYLRVQDCVALEERRFKGQIIEWSENAQAGKCFRFETPGKRVRRCPTRPACGSTRRS